MAKKTFLGPVSDPSRRLPGSVSVSAAGRRAPAAAPSTDASGDAPSPHAADFYSTGYDEPRTLIEQTCARLRDDIIEGRLAPNDKLRVEHMRQDYGVSAGTLREALTRLVSDALVVAEGQRGFHVAPITLQDLIDLTELRVHIELDALRQSIRKGDEAWHLRVREAFDELSTLEQPVKPEHRREWERLNVRFHEALISAHASGWTLKLLRMLARHGERYRRYAMRLPNSARNVHAEHTELYELAVSGKESRAALSLEAHIRNTSDLLVSAERDGVRWHER
jgi:DNA-binding GntR family transcriptional regulator